MKFKYIFSFLTAIIIGFLFGKLMFSQYDSKVNIKPVFSEKKQKAYFLQQGVYSSKESMEENITKLNSYIYEEKEGKFYVYVAITESKENLTKLEGFFKDIGYIIYVKEFNIDNDAFYETLKEYDALLKETDDVKSIKTIINQTLEKYEELMK